MVEMDAHIFEVDVEVDAHVFEVDVEVDVVECPCF